MQSTSTPASQPTLTQRRQSRSFPINQTNSTAPTPSPPHRRRITTRHLLVLSSFIHLALLIYADHVDSHPERYGGLKYTDVDWRVVSDGARLIWDAALETRAEGWLVRMLRLPVGDPYKRATFRYTPLLPLLISPTLIHPLLGKSILSIVSLFIPLLLLAKTSTATPSAPSLFWPTHLIWTLNPFVLNITTRGSPEAFICLLVVLVVYCLRWSNTSTAIESGSPSSNQRSNMDQAHGPWINRAAIVHALAVGWKIYPVIYAPAIWAFLAHRSDRSGGSGWLGPDVWRFGIVAAATFVSFNVFLWSIWGQPFLDHTFLYHLTRLDHRHNFSPYFYPIYLSLFPASLSPSTPSAQEMILRHPLTSFIPQISLVCIVGFWLTPVTTLEFGMFVQTVVFVIFNKVCTSQYFMWFLPLLPPIIPHLRLTRLKTLMLLGGWVAAQALWLGMAYRLELMASSVYVHVWAAGLGLFAISVWVIGEVIDSFAPIPLDISSSLLSRNGKITIGHARGMGKEKERERLKIE